ncbi:MAG: hypothetical protein F6K09_19825, partial [Merismopedia sp. SIO2A8]|nr:hypothetical protein [Merismopedia sp. SIO2A8]
MVFGISDRLRQHQQDWVKQGIEHRIAALQDWKQVMIAQKSALVDAIA